MKGGLILLWSSMVVFGFMWLGYIHARPGAPGCPPAQWPDERRELKTTGKYDLLLFLHPRCPCSQASLAELAHVVAQLGSGFTPSVVVVKPAHGVKAWDETRGEREAAAIRGVRVVSDPGGSITRRFGVSTSGHVLLYDQAGRLGFSGGITPAQGHQGTNLGRDAVIALISGKPASVRTHPVFGCSLADLGFPSGTGEAP